MAAWLKRCATSSGVSLLKLRIDLSAPCCSSFETTAVWPFCAGPQRGVLPSSVRAALMAAPAAISLFTTIEWPFSAARCSEVQPLVVNALFTLAPEGECVRE